jgi:catechol 2,3-dioxygenase-like lactoylglutathione lyase family enzyme
LLDHVNLRVANYERSRHYGAFVLDPDGYNIEAVCHKPA